MIYFIQEINNPKGYIKIGCTGKKTERNSNAMLTRLNALQTGSPVILVILNVIENEWNDKLYHKKFSHLRKHGEWFQPAQDLLDFISGLPNSPFCGVTDTFWQNLVAQRFLYGNFVSKSFPRNSL